MVLRIQTQGNFRNMEHLRKFYNPASFSKNTGATDFSPELFSMMVSGTDGVTTPVTDTRAMTDRMKLQRNETSVSAMGSERTP